MIEWFQSKKLSAIKKLSNDFNDCFLMSLAEINSSFPTNIRPILVHITDIEIFC